MNGLTLNLHYEEIRVQVIEPIHLYHSAISIHCISFFPFQGEKQSSHIQVSQQTSSLSSFFLKNVGTSQYMQPLKCYLLTKGRGLKTQEINKE